MAGKTKRSYAWMWAVGLAFSATWLTVMLLKATALADRRVIIAPAIAVACTMVAAGRTRSMIRGALYGIGLALASSGGTALAMINPDEFHPEGFQIAATLTAVIAMICCAVAGALFAFLADRRHRKLYGANGNNK